MYLQLIRRWVLFELLGFYKLTNELRFLALNLKYTQENILLIIKLHSSVDGSIHTHTHIYAHIKYQSQPLSDSIRIRNAQQAAHIRCVKWKNMMWKTHDSSRAEEARKKTYNWTCRYMLEHVLLASYKPSTNTM